MDLWKSLAGMVEVELTSAEPEIALGAINASGIDVFWVQQKSELTFAFQIRRKDYRTLTKLCEKRGETLRLLKKTGLYWTGKRLLHRPVLLFGMALFLAMVLYLPSRVFFIRVEGNVTVPARRILAAAEDSGIRFGASRREVRSEKMKNALLAAVPELQWAGVNTAGCVATISVRERTDHQTEQPQWEVASIVASRDGYILSGTVTRGNALFQVGQAVKEGQVLISGYTDCGICIQATRAEGEIMAKTSRCFEAVTPSEWSQRREAAEVKRKYSLLLGKKRINLWKDSGILDPTCGRMYSEYDVTLPGGFSLPVALCVEEYTVFETSLSEIPPDQAQSALTGFADRYLTGQMVAGEIRSRLETVSSEEGVYHLRGSYICVEMIGREQKEQIGDTNGKNS